MTPAEFIAKWRNVKLTERSASQQHFLDLCSLVGHPTPVEADPTGEEFTFEKGVTKRGGGEGWADVWKKGFFAWEYKGRHRDLDAAYDQLLLYREDLENPPLLVVSDMERIVIHTNFTATPTKVYRLDLARFDQHETLDILQDLFHAPDNLRPGITSSAITAQAAGHVAEIAQSMRSRGLDPHQVARFLDRLVFCLFAEDVELLRHGVFTELIAKTRSDPERFALLVGQLFAAMANGGYFVYDKIRHFNGNLFADAAVLTPTVEELARIHEAAKLDWGAVSPSIFGTLFERGMDPGKRTQLGAHYTSEEDISALVEPVVMQPLRMEWAETRNTIACLLATGTKPKPGAVSGKWDGAPSLIGTRLRKARGEAESVMLRFLHRLAAITVLDPACGSGNFLYVTLQKLKDLEKEAILFAMDRGLGSFLPGVGPWQLHGIEVNPYAFDLAQMTIWIGYLQWTRANGFQIPQDPVLKPMPGNFQCRDAILSGADSATPGRPAWPSVEFIVGNPPFLGGKLLRRELGDAYIDSLFAAWAERVPREADLCCYWFESARVHIAAGKCKRAGLLATQGIRGGANRKVLEQIQASGAIFFAESDRPWILDGANVHVSMVGFDDGSETRRQLDGRAVATIAANLTAAVDTTMAKPLAENIGLAFMGTTKQGAFDVPFTAAEAWLYEPNPGGRPSSDVLFPWLNGMDVTRRSRGMWIIDNGKRDRQEAARYAGPYAHLDREVRAFREANPRAWYRPEWWQLYAPRPEMHAALAGRDRFIATPRVAKHRLFVWVHALTCPDCQLIVFARSDDYFFGVLHSRLHEVWALAQGTQLREKESGFRYTPTTCFETFPFPWTPGREPVTDAHVAAIGAAAKALCELRDSWLNPSEWMRVETLEFPGTVGGPWDRFIPGLRATPPADAAMADAPDTTALEFHLAERAVEAARERARTAQPLKPGDVAAVRFERLVPRDADSAKRLAKRTLTALYNERPVWLVDAHRQLDQAVCSAYASVCGGTWTFDMPEDSILAQLIALNLERSQGHEAAC